MLTQTQKMMSQTVDNPKCILGHTLSKQYASCLKTNIQCTECEEFIFNKEEYWKCGCCSYPYDLCVKCCYDTFMINNNDKELDLDSSTSTTCGIEILTQIQRRKEHFEINPTQNMNRSETEPLTDTEYLSIEHDDATIIKDNNQQTHLKEDNNDIDITMNEQNVRTPLSVYLGLFPPNEQIQREMQASLRFYDNPTRSILYPNTKAMQFTDGKGAQKVYIPQQSKITLQEYELELSQDSDDKCITMSQYQYFQEPHSMLSQDFD